MVGSRGGAGFFKFKIWYLKFINNLGVLCVPGVKKLAARNLILKIQAAKKLCTKTAASKPQSKYAMEYNYIYFLLLPGFRLPVPRSVSPELESP